MELVLLNKVLLTPTLTLNTKCAKCKSNPNSNPKKPKLQNTNLPLTLNALLGEAGLAVLTLSHNKPSRGSIPERHPKFS